MSYHIPGTVVGSVVGRAPPARGTISKNPNPASPPETKIPRCINYLADYSGCGYWRMAWPEQILTAYQKVIVHGSTCMVRDPGFYHGVKAVRMQRQANPNQLVFFRKMRELADANNFNLIYEIDDVVLREDIPDYNKYKFAFTSDEVRSSIITMMQTAHEMTVTCDYMKDYYISKTGNKNVTVIPNYPPRFWLDGLYDEALLEKNYDRHVKKRKKPRILYAGSGAHFDVENNVNQRDDFHHVLDTVRKTCNKIQWVFLGGHPMSIRDLVQSGKVEFHQWKPLYDLPRFIYNLKINCMVAPLLDNIFNRCKSDIKYVEACAYGIPIVCQDMVTYENTPYKFNTGDEMIDQVYDIIKDKQHYMKISRRANAAIQDRWLENTANINKYVELYTLPYGSPERKLL